MTPRPPLLVALALACAPAGRPAEPPREAPAAAAEPARPAPREQPATGSSGQVEEYRPDGAWVGVPQCDAYLELYRKCEPELAAEIAAGERRSARAEAGRLEYFHKVEKYPDLPAACESMLAELRKRCPERDR